MTYYCFICHAPYSPVVSWQHVLTLKNLDILCEKCRRALLCISGETCESCGRPFQHLDSSYRQGPLCTDCIRWQEDEDWKGVLTKNRSVYLYNDFMKEVVSLWKFRGDYAIVNVFQEDFSREFFRHFDDTFLIVPIPLSAERLYERGFNQAKALAELLNLPIHDILTRHHHEKQSKKSRRERLQTENLFQLAEQICLTNRRIVLIDDIYTTGTTLRHAAKLLREAGAKVICSFTLVRS